MNYFRQYGYAIQNKQVIMKFKTIIFHKQIVMTDLEYRNRSISQLVSELNSLGEAKVVL